MNDVPTLTFADAVKAARKAFDEGRLGAQNGYDECQYTYDKPEVVCAIGASYAPEDPSDNGADIGSLILRGVVEAPVTDAPLLTLLQRIHDTWANGYGMSGFHPNDTPQSLPGWALDFLKARSARGEPVDEALFESFLGTAERQLGLVGEA